jgi:hypothetical protein
MATALVTLQRVWDCRWSRFGYHLTGVSEAMQPESAWVCVREGNRRQISEAECQTCPYWETDRLTAVQAPAPVHVVVAERAAAVPAAAVLMKVVLLITAVLFVGTGVITLTGPLAVPFTVSLWLCAAAFTGLVAFWHPRE